MQQNVGRKLKTSVFGLGVLAAILTFPARWTLQGVRCASFLKENGLAIDVPPKLDGFGFSLKASQDALDNKVPMNRELFEEISQSAATYIQTRYGVGEGVSGWFFGMGVRLGS